MKEVFEIKKAVSFGWEGIKKNFWYFVGITFLYLIISSASSIIDRDNEGIRIIDLILSAWVTAGFVKILLDYHANKKDPVSTLFTQTKYFWRMLGATILLGLIIVVGLIFFIIPGIYLALRYQFTINFIVDKDMGIFEAMGESARITSGQKWQLLLFNLAQLGIIILGAMIFGVGIFIAIPIVYLADIHVYKQLLGHHKPEK